MTQNEKSTKLRKVAAGILGTLGFMLLLGSAGTEDVRDEMEHENYTVGYEKHNLDDLASQKTTTALALTGVAAMAGCAFLLTKKKNENQR